MGGSSSQTVGYKYYLGVHKILCHGPVDKILRIRVDDRDAWIGERTGGRITVNSPELFGGESREGGVQGEIDFEVGGPTQGVNDYLQSRLGGLVPAFRGVVGVVLRQVYMGMNPYLKKWSFRLTRIHVRQRGRPQWYYPRAEIKVTSTFRVPQMFYFAVDKSTSMDITMSGGSVSRFNFVKQQLNSVIDAIDLLRIDSNQRVDICILGWSGTSVSIIQRDMTTANIPALKAFVNGLTTDSGGTNFDAAFAQTVNFFQPGATDERRRGMFFITDGAPFPSTTINDALANNSDVINQTGVWANSPVNIYGINIDLSNVGSTARIDNTPGDGVPVVRSTDSNALYNAVFFATMGDASSMNPAHIIRECITDPDWGMGYADSDVDDASFAKAADQLYQERLGISILWDRQKKIEEFINDIVKHIDASLYVDRKTGLFTLKLIRGGYVKSSLIHLDESNISSIQNFARPAFGELANAVTVQYWNVNTGRDASVIAQDIALQQMQGVTIGTTIQYPGIVEPLIASRLAQRDLLTLSTQRASCTIIADRSARNLTVGDVFRMSWADYNLTDVVMRVTGIAYGDGKNTNVKISCTEDTFDLPSAAFITPAPPIDTGIDFTPLPCTRQAVFEMPYVELTQMIGASRVNSELLLNPDLGFLGAAAGTPSSASINARLFVAPSGTSFSEAGVIDFCPSALLASNISRFQTSIGIMAGTNMDQLITPSWAQIGDELIWVESYDHLSNTITVRRCIYDTVPARHDSGSVVLFWDNYGSGAATEYVTSEILEAKLLTVTGQGILDISVPTASLLTIEGRAARPYRPARLAANDDFELTPSDEVTYPATLTWSHRNRIQETGGAPLLWNDGSVTPEEGTTYIVTVYGASADDTITQFHQENVGLADSWVFDPVTHTIPPDSIYINITVHTLRSDLLSWRPAEINLPLLRAPGDLAYEEGYLFTPADVTLVNVGGGV
jgi:hypothetical protein